MRYQVGICVFVVSSGDLIAHIGRREAASMSPDPEDFALAKDHGEDEQIKEQAVQGDAEQVFAADYDPSLDRREDEQRRVRVANETLPIEVVGEEEEEEVEIDDMFAVAMGEGKKVAKVKKVVVSVACNFLISVQMGADFAVSEIRGTCINYDHFRFRCGSGRLLSGHPGRTLGWRTISGFLLARQGNVCECRSCPCAPRRCG